MTAVDIHCLLSHLLGLGDTGMNNSTGSLAKVSYLLRYKPDNILAPIEEAYDIATEPENLPYASRIAIFFRDVNASFLNISPLYFQWPWQLEVQQHFVAS